jgi:hypothetical protein
MKRCIRIRREIQVEPIADPVKRKAVLDAMADNANDWTHFTHVHSRHIARYSLLYKQGRREIFLYRARRLYPLPWFDNYVVFRDWRPEQAGYCNLYYHVSSGRRHYLDSFIKERPDGGVELIGEFIFELPFYWWRLRNVFFWIFKKRMRTLVAEDDALIRERLAMKNFESGNCKPRVPEAYDMFDVFYNGGKLPEAGAHFIDRQDMTDVERHF